MRQTVIALVQMRDNVRETGTVYKLRVTAVSMSFELRSRVQVAGVHVAVDFKVIKGFVTMLVSSFVEQLKQTEAVCSGWTLTGINRKASSAQLPEGIRETRRPRRSLSS